MLSSPFRIVFFGVFLCVSHFASVFTVFLPTRLFAHGSLDFHLNFSSVQALEGMGGGGDDVHANADWVLCLSF